MNLLRLLSMSPLLLVSCASPLQKATLDQPGLVLAQEEKRECKAARIVFPAGTYTAEVKSDRGIYYLAPAKMRTEGVLIGGGYRGGLFIANDGRQAAWFGDARDDADERPGTLLGAIGASAPKLWPFTPPIAVTQAKSVR